MILSLLLLASSLFAAETRTFTMYTIETGGVKMWVPSTLVVKKDDTVVIKAASKIAKMEHGLAIDAFKVRELVGESGKELTFKATQAGIFPISCHVHPAHLGAQLVVLD